MADFKRGIKAGVATAGIYLVISAILGAIYQNNPLSIPQFIYATGFTPLSLTALTSPAFAITFILVLIVPYIVRGIVFGAVLAALYGFLPGTKSVGKGVVLSLFLCIVAVFEALYMTPGLPTDGIAFAGHYYIGQIYVSSSISMVWPSIVSALIFGALTGLLWDRFRPKELTEERKGRSILLLSFIFGVLMWALHAIGFIIGVVIGGLPIIVPGPGWWYGILATSVVFLGLPGWVLAYIGWRKTKVDESGFKWCVSGGVLMALTGLMLFPGALAITGGVFSRRKPAIEPSSNAAIEQ